MGKRYLIKSVVEFYYESNHGEFDSLAEAEAFAGNYDNLHYEGLYDGSVEEIETCDECEEDMDCCVCEEADDE